MELLRGDKRTGRKRIYPIHWVNPIKRKESTEGRLSLSEAKKNAKENI